MRIFEKALLAVLAGFLICPGLLMLFRQINRKFLPSSVGSLISLVEDRPLLGLSVAANVAPFTISGWFRGDYQRNADEWFRANYGLRRLALQLNNQFLYSFLSSSVMYDGRLIVGRHKNLYELEYIYATCNLDAQPTDLDLSRFAARIKAVEFFFSKHHIPFILILAPTKGYTNPEDFPGQFHPVPLPLTAYGRATNILTDNQVDFVDGQAIAQTLKQEAPGLVFPLGGTHWTELAALRTLNAGIRRLNSLQSQRNVRLPELEAVSSSIDYVPRGRESDLLQLANLYSPNYSYPVPHLGFSKMTKELSSRAVNIAIVGDSFGSGLFEMLHESYTGPLNFYYYYTLNLFSYPLNSPFAIGSPNRDEFRKNFLDCDAIILETVASKINTKHVTMFIDDVLKYEKEEVGKTISERSKF